MTTILGALANMATTAVGAAAGFQITLRAQQNLQPHPLSHRFASLLEHPWRVEYLEPPQVLDIFGVGADMTVLDLGCGTGLFTRAAAHMVGAGGRVHAVDLQAAMLEQTGRSLALEGVAERVSLHLCGAYELPLPDNSIDVAFLISTLGEIPDKPAALNELRRVLKPGARLGITEEVLNPAYMWTGSTQRYTEEAGFQRLASNGFLPCNHTVLVNVK